MKRLAAGVAQVLKAEAEVSESKHGKGRSDGVPLGVISVVVCCGAVTANHNPGLTIPRNSQQLWSRNKTAESPRWLK